MSRHLFYLVIAALLTLVVSPTIAQASPRMDLTVNSFNNDADANVGDAICDTDLSKAGDQCSLRAALTTIRFNGNNGSVTLPAGVYTLSGIQPLSDVDVITITGAGQGKTIIDFSGMTTSLFSTNDSFIISDLTFRSTTLLEPNQSFSVITSSNPGNVIIRRVTFTGGSMTAVKVDGESVTHTVTLEDVTIDKFVSSRQSAILFDGTTGTSTSVMLRRLTLRNSAMQGSTDSLIHVLNGLLQIEQSRFENNTSSYRGVIQGEFDSFIVIESSVFKGNSAFDGGAIFADRASIVDTVFQNNYASHRGGAVTLQGSSSSPSSIARSAFIENSAGEYGGGLAIGNDQSPTILNSTFSGNFAGQLGGGIYINGKTGNAVTLKHLTVAENFAVINGGGIHNDNVNDGVGASTVTVSNSVLFNNNVTVNFTSSEDCGGTFVNGGGNWVPNHLGRCSFTPASSVDFTPPPLAFLGGHTPIYAMEGSPAVGLGVAGQCDDIDQRDLQRPSSGNCTAGAYEVDIDEVPLTVKNPSFEAPIGSSNWRGSGLSKDKRVCDKPATGKFFSHSGKCAFVFQDKAGKLTQALNPTEVSTLFNHYIFGAIFVQNSAPNPGIVLTLKFTDANNVSETITLDLTLQPIASATYRSFGFNTEEPLTITPVKGVLTLQFKGAGKLYLDDIAVYGSPAGSRPSRPTVREGVNALPLPQAPDGFRGGN